MQTQVMKFGARRVIENRELAHEQMSLAHRYYNALVELERYRRTQFREIRSRFVPGLDAAEQRMQEISERIEELRDVIKIARKRASVVSVSPRVIKPTRTVDKSAEVAEMDGLKAERKELSPRLKALKATFGAMIDPGREAFKARVGKNAPVIQSRRNAEVLVEMLAEPEWSEAWKLTAALDAQTGDKRRQLRAESGVAHGTYIAVEEAVQAASKPPKPNPDRPLPKGRPKERPSFAQWDGGRKLGVQIRDGGALLAELQSGNHGQVQIVQRRKPYAHVAGNRRDWEYAVVRIRVGTDDARQPIWIGAEVLMHRPIPADALIRWVYLVPHRDGLRTKYTVQFTVQTEAGLRPRKFGEGVAQVELRWSRERTPAGERAGLIVAVVNGSEQVVLPAECVTGRELSNALRGAADQYFDEARDALREWAKVRPVPEWMGEALAGIAQWRNHGKLARVVRRWLAELPVAARTEELWGAWKAERLELRKQHGADHGDLHASYDVVARWLAEHGVADERDRFGVWLEWWRRKDEHLIEWSGNATRRATGRRRDFYRVTARRLCERFERVEVKALELDKLALRVVPESDDKELHEAARRQRVYAAPSELVAALKQAFGPDRFTQVERFGGDEKPGGARDPGNSGDPEHIGDAAE